MNIIETKYQEKCRTPSDINEHLPTLRKYAANCRHVTELGVRTVVSTWALLSGLCVSPSPELPLTRPRTLVSMDIAAPAKHGGNLAEVIAGALEAGIVFDFIEADDRKVTLEETDLLFIDTWHVYEQLKVELELHSIKARQFIVLHDTETFGVNGETAGHIGLTHALTEFLLGTGDGRFWRVVEHFKNNNGLTVLHRVTEPRK